mgnify:CR=1 FL=1
MNLLREINFDMDDVDQKVTDIENRLGGKRKTRFDEEIKKSLMKDLEKEESPDKNPRNYHAPENPVRRNYENGIELVSGHQTMERSNGFQPGFPQSLYPQQPRSFSGERSSHDTYAPTMVS